MSFNVGNKSVQREFKRFIGVASVEVLAFNPTQEELAKLYNTDSIREPVYIDKTPEGVERVKLVFYLQPNKLMHKEASTMILPVTFTITNQFVVGRNSGKHQVIDSYGRTGWVTKEQLDNHEIPTEYQKYKLLEDDYRPTYVGEENLTKFIKAYANIPNLTRTDFKTKEVSYIENPNDAKARFNNLSSLFKGDFAEILGLLSVTKGYLVKVAVGVRTTDENKLYQDVFNRAFIKNAASSYRLLEREIKNAQDNGAFSSTEFKILPLHEYKVEQTLTSEISEIAKIENKPLDDDYDDLPMFFNDSNEVIQDM